MPLFFLCIRFLFANRQNTPIVKTYNENKSVNICKVLGLTYKFCRNSGNKIKSALHMRAIQLIFSKGEMELIR